MVCVRRKLCAGIVGQGSMQEQRRTLGFQPRDSCSIVAEAEEIQSSCRYPIMPGERTKPEAAISGVRVPVSG